MPRKDQMDRSTTFYFPSKEVWDEWKQAAEALHSSLNNYIFEMAERGRRAEEDRSGPDLIRENGELKNRNRALEHDVELLKKNLENIQTELYKLQFAGFDQADSGAADAYDVSLIKMLKGGRVLDSQEILAGLGIDPRDGRAVKLVSTQLEELRRFGLVAETVRGWRWI